VNIRCLCFQDLTWYSDNLPFSYVILFLHSLICHYIYENRSWHTYSYALGFLWKNRCDKSSLFGTCILLHSDTLYTTSQPLKWLSVLHG
jgi:hypothetical protein